VINFDNKERIIDSFLFFNKNTTIDFLSVVMQWRSELIDDRPIIDGKETSCASEFKFIIKIIIVKA